jgi:hypothetical protein
MRQHTWVSVFLFAALGTSVAEAAPIEYTINFTLISGTEPTAGSFTYDSATTTFANFTVTWDGLAWDLANGANHPSISSTAPACLGGLTGAAAAFAQLDRTCFGAANPSGSNQWIGNPEPPPNATMGIFRFLTGGGSNGSFIEIFSLPQTDLTGDTGTGQWSITAISTPEPSTFFPLLATLLSAALVARKRSAMGLRRATRTNR